VEAGADPKVLRKDRQALASAAVERVALEVEPGVTVPLLLLLPSSRPGARLPVVVGLAQEGKRGFLARRPGTIAELLGGGAAVCLVDVRGTGETRPGDGSPRYNGSRTTLSATEWLLGQTLVGSRLRDLRSALRYLRGRPDLDGGRVALWGDSFAPPNPAGRDLTVPLDADPFPDLAEPLGGLLALFGALFDDDIRAVAVRGGLSGYASLLADPFCYVPHDALVPAALTAGDLCDVAAALAPRPLRMEGLVDGHNREVAPEQARGVFEPSRAAYRSQGADSRLLLAGSEGSGEPAARWLLRQLQGD
jgi:hypothetical protein